MLRLHMIGTLSELTMPGADFSQCIMCRYYCYGVGKCFSTMKNRAADESRARQL